MHKLKVDLGDRSYPIYCGENLISQTSLWSNHIIGSQVVIITNDKIADLYLQPLTCALQNYYIHSMVLPDGEQYKNLEILGKIFDFMMENHCDRQTTLIALGGGVIGDIAGFAASCYRRGIPFLQIPTTLLAQVDSSVGGKTAVNHSLGKNMIGAFYQPICVLADILCLHTLPEREYSSGIAEIIKYGLIGDQDFYNWLEINMSSLLQKKTEIVIHAIYHSCKMKASIVSQDERETHKRAILNFGHTFGHAFETIFKYRELLHGEAVAIGMLMAVDYSCRAGFIDRHEKIRLANLLNCAGLPLKLPKKISRQQMLNSMYRDKKVKSGVLNLILLKKVGEAFITDEINFQLLNDVLDTFLN